MKRIGIIVLAFIFSLDLSAQWAMSNFEAYLVNGRADEYITNSKNELPELKNSDRKNVLLTISLYEMLTKRLNNQLDLEDFYDTINLLDLEYTQHRYDVDYEFVIGQIVVNERRYYILLNESEEYLLNVEFNATRYDNRSFKTIRCGAWNYCAKLFDVSNNPFYYEIISYNHKNRGLTYRPCILR